jgi:hypothetical protein
VQRSHYDGSWCHPAGTTSGEPQPCPASQDSVKTRQDSEGGHGGASPGSRPWRARDLPASAPAGRTALRVARPTPRPQQQVQLAPARDLVMVPTRARAPASPAVLAHRARRPPSAHSSRACDFKRPCTRMHVHAPLLVFSVDDASLDLLKRAQCSQNRAAQARAAHNYGSMLARLKLP